MQTLTYGFKRPQTGDKGGGTSGFWAALEFDIQQLNDHTHNGSNSSKLTGASVTALKQNVSSAAWSLQSDGGYRQLVTMPGTTLFDDYFILFRDQATKNQMFLGVEKVSSNTYYVYCNDNSFAITAYYLS